MHTTASFHIVLVKENFGEHSRTTIVEFCCDNLTKLAQLPSKKLDKSIGNLHKALANHATENQAVQLSTVKCILLHALCTHFINIIKCNSTFLVSDIRDIVYDNIQNMHQHYLESEHATATQDLNPVKMKKLTVLK